MIENSVNVNSITDKEKYDYLIKARNFHYDNFSKWLSYFYVAIAALFVGYYSIAKEPSFEDKDILELAILILGYLVSLFWYWSSKGYYYWNINFIMLVNHHEVEIFKWKDKEGIYSVFANKSIQNAYGNPVSGSNISTSKVAILFGYTVTLFWGFILCIKIIDNCSLCSCRGLVYFTSLICSAASIWFLSITFARLFLSSFTDHMHDLKLEQKTV